MTAVRVERLPGYGDALPERKREGLAVPPLAGSLAHAINGPLAALIGNLELLLGGREPAPAQAPLPATERAARALRLAYRIRGVVERTLQLQRCARLERRPERIESILRDVQLELEPRASAAGVSLELEVDPALPRIEVDRTLLAVALAGLGENALDAMPEGGTLTLRAEYAVDDAIAIIASDTGPGIPAELRERVLEPFFSTRSGGTGLGLWIAREVTRAHAGRIQIDERPGGGARVRVELPRRAPLRP